MSWISRSSRRLLLLQGGWAALSGLAGCATSPEAVVQMRHLKTEVVIRRADGTLVSNVSAVEDGDRKVYVVTVHANHLAYFKGPELEAAEALVRATDSAPGECPNAFTVVRVGRIEGGGAALHSAAAHEQA